LFRWAFKIQPAGQWQISLSKLNKHYGSLFHAVKDVDLEIADKEFVALVARPAAASRPRCHDSRGWRTSRAAISGSAAGSSTTAAGDRDVAMVFQTTRSTST